MDTFKLISPAHESETPFMGKIAGYKLKYENIAGIIHVEVTGTASIKAYKYIYLEVASLLLSRNANKAIVNDKLEEILPLRDFICVYQAIRKLFYSHFLNFALIRPDDYGCENQREFIQLYFNSHMLNLSVFKTFKEAIKWITIIQ